MRTVVVGNNILACNILEWLAQEKEEIIAVIPENKDCVTYNVEWEKPFMDVSKKISAELNIPRYIGSVNRYVSEIKELKPELIAFCRTVALVKPEVLEIPSRGCSNLHYGMLPKYGGCDTIPHAVLDGEREIGVTLHYMDGTFDTGPILEQRSIDITGKRRRLRTPGRDIEVEGLTGFEIYQLANSAAFEIFKEQYVLIKEHKEKTKPQDSAKKLYYRRGEIDYQKHNRIALSETEERIGRHARAFTYPPKRSKPIGVLSDGMEIELILEGLYVQ